MEEKEISAIIGLALFSFIFAKLSMSIFQDPKKAANNLSVFAHEEVPGYRYIPVNKIFGPTSMIILAVLFIVVSIGAGIQAVISALHLLNNLY